MHEEEMKQNLIDYHQSYRHFPPEESQQERAARVGAITTKRAEIFATAGKFDYGQFLKNLGFEQQKVGYDSTFTIRHPNNYGVTLRILARSTNRTEATIEHQGYPGKRIHELLPSPPDSPDAVYQLLDRFVDQVPTNRHPERLANAELAYLKNVNTNK